jgi:hypothetical protein
LSESSPLQRAQPWGIREGADCFVIEDAIGFPVGYIYVVEEEQRRAETGQMSRHQALEAAKRTVALQAARAAVSDFEKKLKAEADQPARKRVPREFN